MSILWWEKTVEYYFVQKFVNLSMFIAPLDGNHEKAGDAIFSNENKWVLIEFKRDQSSVSDEENKFVNFSLARDILQSQGDHHLIIYGDAVDNDFEIKCQQYFSGVEVDINHALEAGVSKSLFLQYLNEFVKHKKGESGSGGYSFVAGISSDGTVTKCMKLSEFAEALNLEKKMVKKLQQEQEISRGYSGPSLRR
jgi:hypothetical protein